MPTKPAKQTAPPKVAPPKKSKPPTNPFTKKHPGIPGRTANGQTPRTGR